MSATPRVLICMADHGQDPTECAVPWKRLSDAGFVVDFATEQGAVPFADQLLVQPSFFKSILGPKQAWTDLYQSMAASPAFATPHAWAAPGFTLVPYAAVILPGGHDKPIRQYLESASLHRLLQEYWPLTARSGPGRRVVGAICHGVLVLAFSGLLRDVETTTLPWWLEVLAECVGGLWGSARAKYYRTYPDRYTYEEVLTVVANQAQYKRGPVASPTPFVCVDPSMAYVSARWPGDAELFADTIISEVRKAEVLL